METQKQVVHFEAKKGFTTAQSNEHQRRWTERGWAQANENGRIDRSRTRLNFEVTKGGKVQKVDKSKSIPEKFLEKLSALEYLTIEKVTNGFNLHLISLFVPDL